MTDEQIIELAKEHLEVLVADDDEMEFPTDFAATKEQLIEFAQRIRRGTMITLDFQIANTLEKIQHINPEVYGLWYSKLYPPHGDINNWTMETLTHLNNLLK
jgi:L-ribulose-5-phosphate 3-epimerase UlaE